MRERELEMKSERRGGVGVVKRGWLMCSRAT